MPDNTSTALPMREAAEFWRNKTTMGASEFNKLAAAAKLKAFAVSAIANGHELSTVFAALQKALESGISYNQFRKECKEIFNRRGWRGKRAWRVDNIFRTNVQTAFNVGRYRQMQRVKSQRPYWQYDAVQDRRSRPAHKALDGKVFPADHQFWDQWYPPNGFRCRCGVVSLSKRQVEKKGLTVEDHDPTGEPVMPPGAINPIQLLPDPGFSTHPGKDYWGAVTPAPASGKVVPLVSRALCGMSKKYAEGGCKQPLSAISKRHIIPINSKDLLPDGLASEEYVKAFLHEFDIKDIDGHSHIFIPGSKKHLLPINKGLFIDKSTGAWKIKTQDGRHRYVRLLAKTVKQPYEAWLVPAQISGRVYSVINLIRLFSGDDGKIGGFIVWSLAGGVWRTSTAFSPKLGQKEKVLDYLEKQRVGRLLYRERP